ncbi:MAG: tandem-95 repeat protein, partial [Burkholderiales bacterium]|nr:tandem-95 repeat protein [Opitutaceae bacterium]
MLNYIILGLVLGLLALTSARGSQVGVGTARVQEVPAINGGATVDGSIQMMSGGTVNLNGGATITGDLLVPGTPTVRLNGKPDYAGTLEGAGPTAPSDYTITLNGNASLRHVIRRTAPVALAALPNPPAPVGTRSVNLNNAGQSVGTWSTLRNLTLNGNVGQISVPPGTYGDFTASGGSGFTFGVAGATEAAVYNFQRFNFNGQSQLRVVGPVVINLKDGFSANGQMGSTEQPGWLTLNIASGSVNLNGGSSLYAVLNAPASGVIINGNSRLVGGLTSQSLIVNGGGLLRLTTGGVAPPANTAPVAVGQTVTTLEDTARTITLAASDAQGDALTYTLVTPPAHGTLSGAAPALTYVPALNFYGTDSFVFRARDTALDSNLATVSITVVPLNDAPVALAQNLAVNEGSTLAITLAATDVDGDALTYALIDAPAVGMLTLAPGAPANGPNYLYTPPANQSGATSFAFRANDGAADSAPATVTITFTNLNNAPVAAPAAVELDEDASVSFALSATDADGDPLAYAIATPPTHGVATIAGNFVTYTPAADYFGVDAFVFIASDDGEPVLASSPATVSLTVRPINDAPTAGALALSTAEDTALAVALIGADTEGEALTHEIVAAPAHGVLSGVAPALTYTPAVDFNGADAFTYRVSDGQSASAVVTVGLTITPVNDAPTAQGQALAIAEGELLSITLGGADSEGSSLTYTILVAPALGTLAGEAPHLTYTPPANTDATATFTFTVSDGDLDSAPATVSIMITNRNIAPVASGAGVSVVEDAPQVIELVGTDADGDALSYTIHTPPTRGMVNIVGRVATYTPTADAVGSDAFMFTVSDGEFVSSPATVALTITPVNDAPVAAAQALATDEEVALAITQGGADVDGDTLAYAVTTPPAHGTLSGVAPNLIYTPAADFHGTDSFAFNVADAALISEPATIAITVRPVNDAPVALAQNLAVKEGETLVVTLAATDVDGDALFYALVERPAPGTLVLAPGAPVNGPNFLYTPPANRSGETSLTFKANDGSADSVSAVVEIAYSNINDAPVAVGATVALDEDASVTFALSATDPDGDALSYALATPPTHGVVTLEGNLAIYVPVANHHGADTFSFVATDNGEPALASAPAVISLTVRPVNDAPTAEALVLETAEDTDLAVTLGGADIDGDVLSYEILTPPAHGVLSGNAPALTYTPAANFHGTDAFTYRVSDSGLASVATLIALTVMPVNDAPVADAAGYVVNEGQVLPILLTATDVDGDALTYEIVTSPGLGVLSGETPALSYAPPANTDALTEFTFVARDGAAASAPVVVSIEILNVSDAPVATPQALGLAEDTSLAFVLSAVDPDGDALTYEVIVPPAHGILSGEAPTLTYTPDADFHGVDTLLFAARDASLESPPTMVTFAVESVNDAPVAAGQALTTVEDTAFPIILSGVDLDGDALTFAIVSAPAHGVLSGEAPNLIYTPAADYDGADTFTFTVGDGEAVSAPASIAITITRGNDAPVAQARAHTLAEDTALAITLTGDDPDGDALSYQIASAPEHGVLSGEGANLTYTPAANYHGADAFAFTVSDGILVSAAATVTLTITPVNDAPVAQAQAVTVAANASVAVQLGAVDPEGDAPLSFAVSGQPAHGTVSGVAPVLVYEPAYGYSGPDAFMFTASDGAATSASALVAITVTPPVGNQAPRVSLDPVSPAPLPFTAFELVAFARDADGAVAVVEYFVNGAPLGRTTRPVAGDATRFAFLVERGMAAGTYVFTARVTDDKGVTAVSAPMSLTIAYDPNARTFTSTADFEEGLVRTLKAEDDELTTALLPSTFDYVWVSNSSAGTVVRIDSETGRVMGVYRSAPEGSPAFPSSIAVDSEGNAWVANRSGNSVVKIGLGLENGAWVDRNQNFVPNTSEGQGDIRPWPAGGQPADEHILLRVQTAVTGLDHIAVDADNNVWVGGYGGKWQLIDGETGAILREENHPGGAVGGRGGFIDLEGVQVSTGGQFMRWDTRRPITEYDRTFAANVRRAAWGVARDAEGNYWVTQDWSPVLEKYSATGEKLGTYKHGSQWGQGITIDGDGHIWVAHSHCGDTVGHLLPDGTWIGNVKVANHGPTEVSVDRLGRIWVVSTTGVVERINPLGGKIGLDGETPVGEVDLRSPQLGGTLWTYGRFVGDSQALRLGDGFWVFSRDSQIPSATWGPVLWNAILANDAVVGVEVSLSENGTSFGPWQTLTLESPVPVGTGRHLRGRVKLAPSSEGYCPVLFDLTVGTVGYQVPAIPRRWFALAGEDQSANWPDKVQLKGATWHSAHAWSETPTYQWTFVGFTPLAVGGGTAPIGGSVVFSDATDPRSQAQFSGVGEYRLRLTSTLHGISSSDEVVVRLTPYNKLPYVSANEHLFLRDYTETAILDGVARDDGLPLGGTFVSTWEKAFGPGNVTFADVRSPVTTATFSAPGLYVLRIRGHDGELQSTSGMSVYAGLECSEPPPRGLISWWQANGGGADHISGNQAFPELGANFAEGHVGPAFNFDGINDRVHVFGNDSMNVGVRDGLGLEFWVRPADSREATLLEYGSGVNTRGVSVRQSGTTLVVDFKDVAGVSHVVTLNGALPANVWTHLSINYDRASGWVHLFRNGEWSDGLFIGIFSLQTSYDFRMGASWAADGHFKGLIDEVSLYDRGLMHAEAWRIYAEGRAGKRRPVTNTAPVVNAGGDYVGLSAGGPVQLRGSVTDDGMPLYQTVKQRWVMLSGPVDGVVAFANATDPRTTATFSKPGLYTLRLEADDGAFCTKKTAQVRVAVRDSVEVPSGLMAWWTGNRTTEELVSGRQEPWAKVGYMSAGKVGSAFDLVGSGAYVLSTKETAQANVGATPGGF